MSAVASIIFESHLHCTKDNLPGLFYSCDVREREISGAKRGDYERFRRGERKREEVFWLWRMEGYGMMGKSEAFGIWARMAFREGFGFFSGRAWARGSVLKM
mgnify:CR=1 FL=1